MVVNGSEYKQKVKRFVANLLSGHISVYVYYSYKIFSFATAYIRSIHNSLLSTSLNKSLKSCTVIQREKKEFS